MAVLVLACGWWRSSSGLEAVARRWGSLRGPGNPASTDLFERGWSYTAREVRLDHHGGALRAVVNTYRSYGDSRELVADWQTSWPGWTHERLPGASGAKGPRWYVKSATDWSAGRLALTGGMHKGVEYRILSIPYWALMLTAGLPAGTTGAFALRRARRIRHRCCLSCGYELGAQAGCPECGAGLNAANQGAA